MARLTLKLRALATGACVWAGVLGTNAGAATAGPRFSLDHLNRDVSPRTNFFEFANGTWVRGNPVPADKSRWTSLDELAQRNWDAIRTILEEASADGAAAVGSPRRLVGDFYAAAMDTNRIERLGFGPIERDLQLVASIRGPEDAMKRIADWHLRDIDAVFGAGVSADAKQSDTYALYFSQGGLGLPDRDYYLTDGFAKQREEYRKHIATMLRMVGDSQDDAEAAAATILDLETQLAKASRSRTELRDREKNYHKKTRAELKELAPDIAWDAYFEAAGMERVTHVIVGQPEFFQALNKLAAEREPTDWFAYLRWCLVRSTAHLLHAKAEAESFRFFGTVLRGQPQPEPRWQRSAREIDGGFGRRGLGEALGSLFVERHFPPQARAGMLELVAHVREVFRDRLGKVDWMTPETRAAALKKFERFTAKIGHPEKFLDYAGLEVRRDDHVGNVHRAAVLANRRELDRIGRKVDRTEWGMTPQTVNAYFNPTQNEIVFPAGILQPPFFDSSMDDAVNYGAIGSVIGHEITHGYDDQGRKYDADGNLKDWWTEADAKEFGARAEKLVRQYGGYEALPGARINGQLTLGENIADLGGTSIAFEAMQRALAKDPAKRREIGGFTPEQRFFLGYAQVWRVNTREAELRRRLVVDPHSPPQFRAYAPLLHQPAYIAAFGIREGDPMWLAPENRAKIW